jgi:putative intracellular protease/amidase
MNTIQSILIIVTSANQLSPGDVTGVWLEEFAVPYMLFMQQGYSVSVASIQGGAAPIDPRSDPSLDERLKWKQAIEALEHTQPLAEVDPDHFDAVFMPGGHGTMIDFPESAVLHSVLRTFAERKRTIAAVCHGPSSLVNVTLEDGTPLVEGKTVTGFTNQEESAAGLTEKVPFLLESRLREQGANFIAGSDWADHVETDGWLITGQNPQSSRSIAKAVIDALKSRDRQ